MRIEKIVFLAMFALAMLSVSPGSAQEPSAQSDPDLPVAFVPEPEHEFQAVPEGKEVVHDFLIRNAGGKDLIIERIETGCGCTTADYTKQIPPGKEGRVRIKVNTQGYAGQRFSRAISVHTNDPKHRPLHLRISGQVRRFARIEPGTISLKGAAGEDVRASAAIIPDPKYPFRIVESVAKNGKNIRFHVEDRGGRYLLKVRNLLGTQGRYSDTIILKTDHPEKPEIAIRVYGNLRQASDDKN